MKNPSHMISQLRRFRENQDVVGLLDILNASISPKIKADALHALVSIGTPGALEGIGQLLESGHTELSELGMTLLMNIPGPDSIRIIARGLLSSDEAWKLWILRTMASRSERQSLEWILQAAGDPNVRVSQMAARLISEAVKDPERLKALDEETRQKISECLEKKENLLNRLKRFKSTADVEGLAQLLNASVSPEIQKTALEYLASIGSANALEKIGNAIESEDRELAEHGLRLLADMPGEDSVRAMARGLNSSDATFRSYILYSLSHRSEPGAIKWIWKATKDDSAQISSTAKNMLTESLRDIHRFAKLDLQTLEAIFRSFDVKIILSMLAEEYPDTIRLAAIGMMGDCEGDPIAQTLVSICLKHGEEYSEKALSSLETMRSFSADLIIPLLKVDSAETRRRAVLLYARHCSKDQGKEIELLTKDPDAEVRLAALRSLIHLMGEDALDVATGMVEDPSREIRFAAVEFLCGFADSRVIPCLNKAARESEELIYKKAIFSLAARKIWDSTLEDRMLNLLIQGVGAPKIAPEDADGYSEIIQLLKFVKLEKALDALISAAKSSSLRIRRVASEAIEHYPDARRLDAFARLVDTEDKTVLRKVALALGEAGDPRGVIPLIRAVEECGGMVGKNALKFLKKQADLSDLSFLIEALRTRWPSVKIFAARRIENLNSPELIDPLLKAMDDEDIEVQLTVAQALKNFADDDRVANRLVENIGYGDISLRLLVTEIIGEASLAGKKIEAALEPLIRALGNRFLKRKAEQALRLMGDRQGLLAVKRRKIREQMIYKPPKAEELESSHVMSRLLSA
jgi:HEAT repeat protein